MTYLLDVNARTTSSGTNSQVAENKTFSTLKMLRTQKVFSFYLHLYPVMKRFINVAKSSAQSYTRSGFGKHWHQ
jgi:hypothetical protein